MVNFSKQLEAQLVPEWKEAFIDYWQLKKDLKKFHHLFIINSQNNTYNNNIQKQNSIFSTLIKKFSLLGQQLHARHRVIQVHRKTEQSEGKGEIYETELLEQFADNTTEAAIEFFHCLDFQLNKVNKFYKSKEKEFLEKGESLKKQMDFLLELNDVALRKQQIKGSSSHYSKEDDSISSTISCDEEESLSTERTEEEQGQGQGNSSSYDSDNHSDVQLLKSDESEKPTSRFKKGEGKLMNVSSRGRVINCQGKNLRIHIPITNPTRAIKYLLCDDLINQSSKKLGGSQKKGDGNHLHIINRKKVEHAHKMIRTAFIELYKGLGYLKTYRNLNMLGFVKILKKLDKVTNTQVLPIYLRVVESSYFNSSDKVLKLGDEVEEIFVRNFAKGDRKTALKFLKPEQRKESHTVTFFLGLFTGCFVALLVGYVTLAHISGMYRSRSNIIYMDIVYPVLSTFSLLFLHLFLYGCNIFMWRKTRVNYSFIFELSPTKELKYRDVFLICTKSMTAVLGVLFLHLLLFTKGYNPHIQAIPGLLVLVFVIMLVCPINIMYKSSRYRLLSVLRNIVLSPLYKVVMLDFFMADQLCSQVPMLRNLEYVACYYVTGSYKTQDYGLCIRNKSYKDLAYAISFLPYYWRAMQCARRWFEEGDKGHLVNLGKYVSAMLAAGAKVAYEKDKSNEWLCILVIVSSCATLYQLYWDFVKDWGLLQFNSKNPWLRDELMLQNKFLYYFSMALNLVLRLAWLQTIFPNSFGNVDYRVTGLVFAALEIVRRGQWNFYRLENEHLNNAGKFRAVINVPLPFHEVDEED